MLWFCDWWEDSHQLSISLSANILHKVISISINSLHDFSWSLKKWFELVFNIKNFILVFNSHCWSIITLNLDLVFTLNHCIFFLWVLLTASKFRKILCIVLKICLWPSSVYLFKFVLVKLKNILVECDFCLKLILISKSCWVGTCCSISCSLIGWACLIVI